MRFFCAAMFATLCGLASVTYAGEGDCYSCHTVVPSPPPPPRPPPTTTTQTPPPPTQPIRPTPARKPAAVNVLVPPPAPEPPKPLTPCEAVGDMELEIPVGFSTHERREKPIKAHLLSKCLNEKFPGVPPHFDVWLDDKHFTSGGIVWGVLPELFRIHSRYFEAVTFVNEPPRAAPGVQRNIATTWRTIKRGC